METYTITVLQDKVDSAKKQVVKLIHKLKKFGLNSKVTFGSVKLTRIGNDRILTTDIFIEVDNTVLKIDGFDYIATLEKSTNDSNFVYTQLDEDFSDYFETKFRCDHCGTKRDRKKVHLFRDSKGNDKIIASTCSKEYFGVGVNGEINSYLKGFDALELFSNNFGFDIPDEEAETFGCRGDYDKDVQDYVNRCLYICLTEREYISRDRAESEIRCSTTNLANNIGTCGYPFPNDYRELIEGYKLNDIIDYWEKQYNEDKSTFNHNIYTSLCSYNFKDGFVAYGVWGYLKDCLGLFTVETLNEYFGQVKDKVELELKVTTCRSGQGSYGWWELVNFVDRDGRTFSWFASSENDKVEESKRTGDFVKVKATIKKHEEYNDVKQTYITRVK